MVQGRAVDEQGNYLDVSESKRSSMYSQQWDDDLQTSNLKVRRPLEFVCVVLGNFIFYENSFTF